jgi:hypothetical protein
MAEDTKGTGADNAPPKTDTKGTGADNAPPPGPAISQAQREQLVKRAQLAGVAGKSLSGLTAALEQATVDQIVNFEKQIEAVRAKNRETFHVVSPGAIRYDGASYANGDSIELTPAEAEDLGDVVARGKAPPKPIEIAERKAGKYKVAGPGSVYSGGRFREPGTVLDLGEEDARSLAEYVVEA